MSDEINEIFNDTTLEKLDYDTSMKLVEDGKAYMIEGGGKKFLHVYTDTETAFLDNNRKRLDEKELQPTTEELSNSAVELAEMASDNEGAIVELGDLISGLTARVKALEEAQNG